MASAVVVALFYGGRLPISLSMVDKCARNFPHRWEYVLNMGTHDIYVCIYCESLRWVASPRKGASMGSVHKTPPRQGDEDYIMPNKPKGGYHG